MSACQHAPVTLLVVVVVVVMVVVVLMVVESFTFASWCRY